MPSPTPERAVLDATAKLDDQVQAGSELVFVLVGEAFDGLPPYAYQWSWTGSREAVLGPVFESSASCARIAANPTALLTVEDALGQVVQREVSLPQCADAPALPDTAMSPAACIADLGINRMAVTVGAFLVLTTTMYVLTALGAFDRKG